MYYLIAQSFPSHEEKILDAVSKKEEVLPLLALYLRKTKGQLVNSPLEMLNVGVHIIKINDETYKIYQTRNVGWIKNNFYYDHVLTYTIVKYEEPTIKITLPIVKNLKDALLSGEADFDDKDIFF